MKTIKNKSDQTYKEKMQLERNKKIAQKLSDYFDARKNEQLNEMNELIKLTSNAIQRYSNEDKTILKKKVSQNLDDDIVKIKQLNEQIKKDEDPHQFYSNKLLDLLVQSKKYMDLNWNSIEEGDSVRLLNNSNGISWYGTSMLNYMQTTMLEILAVIHEERVCDLTCLENTKIYQLKTSPNIQSIYVAQTNACDDGKMKKNEIMKEWRWSTEETSQIETAFKTLKLVTPSLGFAWGGSRFDNEFSEKYFKSNDASSFVGGFLNFEYLSTELLRRYLGLLGSNQDFHIELGLQGLRNVLKWQKDLVFPEAGHVFLKNVYCGFFIEVDREKRRITVIGFNRWMPFIEGFIKEYFELNEQGNWFRIYEQALVPALTSYVGKTNENSTNLPLSPHKTFFFEVIFENFEENIFFMHK